MSQAAKDGSLDSLTVNLDATENDVQKVEILLKRGEEGMHTIGNSVNARTISRLPMTS